MADYFHSIIVYFDYNFLAATELLEVSQCVIDLIKKQSD